MQRTNDSMLREFVATGDIAGLSIKVYIELLAYAKIFAYSVYLDMASTDFFGSFHY